MRSSAITDIGLRRYNNQDFVYASNLGVGRLDSLFIVADGMGGHNGGGTASDLAVETMLSRIRESVYEGMRSILLDAVEEANRVIHYLSVSNDELKGMGTTIVCCAISGSDMEVVNVGDSRLYVCNDRLTQITVDHSLVEEMVRAGEISRREARNHPDKNIITRAVGVKEEVNADCFHVRLERGDMVLLCSDGLTNMTDNRMIGQILDSSLPVEEKARQLVESANKGGGRDNISVIVIDPFAA
ncbi:MAG: Stp1/IreP family PP2C-type Ser/Thr phosphatase [Lachnospiraceae bacterium]|nr:Stp1/IreP family PP2C-type Ser/Thr phosphatase [Lachnospiraceae bacterium]